MAYLDIAKGGQSEAKKLRKICDALMWQVERSMDVQGNAYSLFQTANLLENKVKERTMALEAALNALEVTNRDLKDASTAAETAQTRLLEAVESISEGFALFDSEDCLALCNTRFKEFWGRTKDTVCTGIPFAELSRTLVREGLIPEASIAPEAWLAERVRTHKHPVEPLVIRLADERWLRVDERPTKDGGIVATYTDITDIKRQEERRRQDELAEKSVLLQSSIDNLSQGVSVFDKNLELVAWNQCFVDLLRLPLEMVRHRLPYAEYLTYNIHRGEYGNDNPVSLEERLQQISAGQPMSIEYRRPDGRVLEVRRNPMPGGGFVTTYSDVTQARTAARELGVAKESLERRVGERTKELTTLNQQLRQEIAERKEVEQALSLAKNEAEQANISKTKFLAAASHDLLQPLNAARLFVSALANRNLPENTVDLVERIDGSLRGVEDMLNALLDISKLDAGAVPIEMTEFPVSAVLNHLGAEFGPAAARAGLEYKLVQCNQAVRTDRRLLGRIVRNLISNAIRYTPSGKVLVGCRRRGENIELQILDTGTGISQDQIGEIFEEFRQLNQETRQGDKGVGLGLAIVKRIADMLGHAVSVHSVHGRGSVFSIQLPRGRDIPRDRRLEGPLKRNDDPLDGLRVLVVDNEKSILEGMKTLLEDWGCDVLTGVDTQHALSALTRAEVHPDIAIVDFHITPEENGVLCMKELRDVTGPDLPGVVVTADRTEAVKALVRKNGMFLLNKPLRPARLRALIGHIHARRGG